MPTGLTRGSVTASSVGLSWTAATDNIGVTGYDVYRGGTRIGSTAGTSYTDTTVLAATAYSYSVRAFDAVGNASAASTALAVSTPASGCQVSFTIANASTVMGQNLYVVGNQAGLGNWSPAAGFALTSRAAAPMCRGLEPSPCRLALPFSTSTSSGTAPPPPGRARIPPPAAIVNSPRPPVAPAR